MTMTERQKDDIINALTVGMSIDDALVLAGVDPSMFDKIPEEDQARFSQIVRQHEFKLLRSLDDVIEKQRLRGSERAITWALEHMYPRYTQKVQVEGQPITINFANDAKGADVEYDE